MDQLIYLVVLVIAVMVVVEFFHIGRVAIKIYKELVTLNAKISHQTGLLERTVSRGGPQSDFSDSSQLAVTDDPLKHPQL